MSRSAGTGGFRACKNAGLIGTARFAPNCTSRRRGRTRSAARTRHRFWCRLGNRALGLNGWARLGPVLILIKENTTQAALNICSGLQTGRIEWGNCLFVFCKMSERWRKKLLYHTSALAGIEKSQPPCCLWGNLTHRRRTAKRKTNSLPQSNRL